MLLVPFVLEQPGKNPGFVRVLEPLSIYLHERCEAPLLKRLIYEIGIELGEACRRACALVHAGLEVFGKIDFGTQEAERRNFVVVAEGQKNAFDFRLEASRSARLVRIDDAARKLDDEPEPDTSPESYSRLHALLPNIYFTCDAKERRLVQVLIRRAPSPTEGYSPFSRHGVL